MTLNGTHTNSDNDYFNSCNEDDIEDDDVSRIPSSADYSDSLENDQQPVGNLFR
jgi:hypothetical protein